MGGFVQASPTTLPPSGAAGGILNGTYPNPTLRTASGQNGADTPLPISSTTAVITTGALNPGTYFVIATVLLSYIGATAALMEAQLAVGTATATFLGVAAGELDMGAIAGGVQQGQITLQAIVTVTVAGTLVVNVKNPNGVTAGTALQNSASFPGATGFAFIRVA